MNDKMKDKIRFSNDLALKESANSVRFKACVRKFFDIYIDIFSGIIYSILVIYVFYLIYISNFDSSTFEILMWKLFGVVILITCLDFIINIFYTGDFEITRTGIDVKFGNKKCFIPKKNIADFEVANVGNSSEQMIVLVLNEPLKINNSFIKRKKFQLIRSLDETTANYLREKFDHIIFYSSNDEVVEDEEKIKFEKKKKQKNKIRKTFKTLLTEEKMQKENKKQNIKKKKKDKGVV